MDSQPVKRFQLKENAGKPLNDTFAKMFAELPEKRQSQVKAITNQCIDTLQSIVQCTSLCPAQSESPITMPV